jgi:hypothetical protein
MKRSISLSISMIFLLTGLTVGASAESQEARLSILETERAITVRYGDLQVLVYQKAELPPPDGAPEAYRRSGFIHPLHSPSGGVLTSIHAPDHLHHMGLWHAWVKTTHQGREVDFWNLKKELGRVRYTETEAIHRETDFVGFTVVQQQLAYIGSAKEERVILEETFTVMVRCHDDAYVIDYDIRQTNISRDTLELPAYRYGGGIAYRGPLSWNKENSDYLTSEGFTRVDGHATRGRWCAMVGPTETGVATVAILGHPSNYDAPQRMRIWDKRGDVFFNYVPTQEKAWSMEPGEQIRLRYRLVLTDGAPNPKRIDRFWNGYK